MRIELFSPLGHIIEVETTEDSWLETLRIWGKKGFRSAGPPPGGFVLPKACHDCFDWAFLGATRDTNGTVSAFGYHWRKRFLSARNGLPEVTKYSRGAWQFEEEGVEGKRQGYVTLIRFEGEGQCKMWCKKS